MTASCSRTHHLRPSSSTPPSSTSTHHGRQRLLLLRLPDHQHPVSSLRLVFAMILVLCRRGAVRHGGTSSPLAYAFRSVITSTSNHRRWNTGHGLRFVGIGRNDNHLAHHHPISRLSSSANNRWRFVSSLSATKTTDYADNDSSKNQQQPCPILQDLNPNQVEAVTQPIQAITRVVAGPGSGKTRVLTSRIAWLLQETPPSERVLAVTFTRKAAGEMRERVHKLLTETTAASSASEEQGGDEGKELLVEGDVDLSGKAPIGLDRVTLGTFHSVCSKILRWNGDLLSNLPSLIDDMQQSSNQTILSGSFNIADQTEQLRLLKEVLKEHELESTMKQHKIKPIQVLNKVALIKSELAHGGQPFPKKRNQTPRALDLAAAAYYPYREKMLSSNCIDFDDLILLTREMLMHYPDVRDRLQRRWKHVLIDEFQDTSKSQLDLVKLVTSDSLLVVGDADQSIYSWRGAHVGSLADFEKEFAKYGKGGSSSNNDGDDSGGVSTVYLMENYRSTSNIVKAAQRIISSSNDKASGADKLRQAMIPKRSKGKAPRIISCEDAQEEAEFVVDSVNERILAGEYMPNHSIAFIYRTNAQSRALEEACVRKNLPYVIFGSATSFYKRQEIKDCLCFLRWLYNGRDRVSMLRAFSTPKRGIGERAIVEFDEFCALVEQNWEELSHGSPKPTPLEVLYYLSGDESWVMGEDAEFPLPSSTLSTRTLKNLADFSKQMIAFREKAKVSPVEEVLSFIVDEMKLIPHLDKISKSKDEFAERKANVEELRQASRRYSSDGACLPKAAVSSSANLEVDEFVQPPLGNFLDDVALVTETADSAERSGEDRHVANMMTVHASKGMEFDTVFLVGMEEGTLPTSQALEEDRKQDGNSVNMEEEKRLCYVAMTRAKSELLMTWRKEVPVFTANGISYVRKRRSRFLDALVSGKGNENKTRAKKPSGETRRKTQSANRTQRPPGLTGQRVASPMPRPRSFSTAGPPYRPISPSARSNSRTPSSVANVPPKARKMVGTAGVNACQPLSPIERATRETQAQQQVRQTRSQSSSPRHSGQSAQRNQSSLTGQVTQNGKTTSQARQVTASGAIDPSWFFPVGSKVKHQQLGEGVVLPSAPSEEEGGDHNVLVEFGNGEKRGFSLHGSDISPIV